MERHSPVDLLVVGLGNKGISYVGTRHNFGRAVIEAFAQQEGWAFHRHPSLPLDWARGCFRERQVVLARLHTFMNHSGQTVAAALKFFGLTPNQLLVVCDDICRDLGVIQVKQGGGAKGHHGIQSIDRALITNGYARIQMGIGPRRPGIDLADYVLACFEPE